MNLSGLRMDSGATQGGLRLGIKLWFSVRCPQVELKVDSDLTGVQAFRKRHQVCPGRLRVDSE